MVQGWHNIAEYRHALTAFLPEIFIMLGLLLNLSVAAGLIKVERALFTINVSLLLLCVVTLAFLVRRDPSNALIFGFPLICDTIGVSFKILFCVVAGLTLFWHRAAVGAEIFSLIFITLFAQFFGVSSNNFVLTLGAIALFFVSQTVLISSMDVREGIRFLAFQLLSLVLFSVAGLIFFAETKSFSFLEWRALLSNGPLSDDTVRRIWIAQLSYFMAIVISLGVFPAQFILTRLSKVLSIEVLTPIVFSSALFGLSLLNRWVLWLSSFPQGVTGLADQPFLPVRQLLSWVLLGSFLILSVQMNFERRLKRFLVLCVLATISAGGLGLVFGVREGVPVEVFHIFFSVLTLLFLCALVMNSLEESAGEIPMDIFAGLLWRKPWIGLAMVFCLLSLAGIPPFSGFYSHVALMTLAVDVQNYGVALFLLLGWLLSASAYLRWSLSLVQSTPAQASFENKRYIFAALPITLIGFFWDFIVNHLSNSLRSNLW